MLIRRIAAEVSASATADVRRPVRVPRGRLLKAGELERQVEIAARRGGAGARILVLLDADIDCPAVLGPRILRRAREARSDRRIEVVLAKREYEAWFLAAIESLTDAMGPSAGAPADVEELRGAKERLDRMRRYRPTADQAALTARFDMAAARRRSPSFDKMWRAVSALLAD